MASISSLYLLSSINNVSTPTSPCSLFPTRPSAGKPCLPSKPANPKRHQVAKVACNANQNKNLSTNNPEGEQQSPSNNMILGNRRDVLIGLGGLGATSFTYNNSVPFAIAEPVEPDLKTCGLPTLPPGAKPTKCCPPASTNVIDFKFPTNQPLRVRQPAHTLSDENIAKYKEAVRLMRALPADDPRSFTQQANIHCAYCHNSYHQKDHPTLDLQVHFSWIFFPFHRWYLYFHERILGSLINDPTFALPFWNWDTRDGMEIPEIFTNRKSSLYDPLRNANHQPPTLVDLNWNKRDADTSGDVDANLNKIYTHVVDVKRPICFFGRSFRSGDTPYTSGNSGAGSLELVHNVLHSWSGDNTQPNTEDMGSLYSSARDPLFYSHHSNVDRFWNIWKSLGRKDLKDRDYLDSKFFFYDENKNLVRVTTRDCLDTRKLGYDFLHVDLPWLNAKPTARRTKAQREAKPSTAKAVNFPFTLNSIVSTVVKRPQKSRSQKDKEKEDETLVFNIKFDRRAAVKFDVMIDEEEDAKYATPKNREFAGSFVNVSHTQTSTDMSTSLIFAIGITELLDDLGADGDDSIVVTLVPQYGSGVIIENIGIDFKSCEEEAKLEDEASKV